ncbi:MAG: DNA double-strand break repair nuclease NurA [Candidatus Diapherotrites archaeon]|nr:DNA double-strand break repair nuclease NurA [Candidatus Diapherotrites archaeon]
MQLHQVINEAVSNLTEVDGKRRMIAKQLLPLARLSLRSLNSGDILEETLVSTVKKSELDCSIAGVDSGFIGKDLLALDLTLIRSVGVVFEYKRGKVSAAHYHPVAYSFPEPHIGSASLEFDEFLCSKSIQRLLKEVGTAKELIARFSPRYCFLDGSIVPQYADKPRKDSKIKSAYHKLLEEFQSLYALAEKKGCELVACVEDSRGSRFRKILQERVLAERRSLCGQLDDCYDAVILDYLLKSGERSFAFSYTGSIKEHPILMDFEERWAKAVHAFYLKPVEFDRPVRVEFLHTGGGADGSLTKHADEIAGIVFAQSCMHREYAFPAVLIEADFHARLTPQEIEIVYDKILNKLGKSFRLRMRRDNRPF